MAAVRMGLVASLLLLELFWAALGETSYDHGLRHSLTRRAKSVLGGVVVPFRCSFLY